MKNMYSDSILKIIKIAKTLNYKIDFIEEPNNRLSLYMKKEKDDMSKILRIPVDIKNKDDIAFYEKVRKLFKKEVKEINNNKILKKLLSKIEDSKKEAELKIVSEFSNKEFNLYYNWVIENRK